MNHPLLKKLKAKDGDQILLVNAPADYTDLFEGGGVIMNSKLKSYQQIHWFTENKKQMESKLEAVITLLKEQVILWILYPKGSSKIQTDLTRDKGWDKLLEHQELQWLTLISIDDTWSAFACRLKTKQDEKKETKPKQRAISDYIDSAKKTITLPDDLQKILKKHPKLYEFFNKLSFTNRKEYVEWIVEAKRPETRQARLDGTIERLEKKWKNPRNI